MRLVALALIVLVFCLTGCAPHAALGVWEAQAMDGRMILTTRKNGTFTAVLFLKMNNSVIARCDGKFEESGNGLLLRANSADFIGGDVEDAALSPKILPELQKMMTVRVDSMSDKKLVMPVDEYITGKTKILEFVRIHVREASQEQLTAHELDFSKKAREGYEEALAARNKRFGDTMAVNDAMRRQNRRSREEYMENWNRPRAPIYPVPPQQEGMSQPITETGAESPPPPEPNDDAAQTEEPPVEDAGETTDNSGDNSDEGSGGTTGS